MDVLYKIIEYLSKENKDYDYFRLYPFTNENIDSYMQFFNLKDKSLLTVGSSSDQAINASLAKCRDITICDICPLTEYFYYLKLASLLILDREDFLNFLCKNQRNVGYNRHLLTKKTFNIIKNTLKSLNYESYYIWEYIFSNYSKKDINELFRHDINDIKNIIYCNRYLKNDYNYIHTRESIMNTSVNFINEDITKLSVNKSFGNIWLSNVAQNLFSQDIKMMIDNCNRLLDNNGKMLLCYFWNTSMTIKGFPIEELSKVDATKIIIPGIYKDEDKNSILVYTKR